MKIFLLLLLTVNCYGAETKVSNNETIGFIPSTATLPYPLSILGNAATASQVSASGVQAGSLGSSVIVSSIAVSAIEVADEVSLHKSGMTLSAKVSSVTLQGNTFNGANQLVQLDGNTKLPAVDGSALLNLPSTEGGAVLAATQTFTGTNSFMVNNVGIGTTNPTDSLTIVDGAGRIDAGVVAATYSGFFFGEGPVSASSYSICGNGGGMTLINAATGGDIRLRINNVDKVTISSYGYVGVGITNPASTFQIGGSHFFDSVFVSTTGSKNIFSLYLPYNGAANVDLTYGSYVNGQNGAGIRKYGIYSTVGSLFGGLLYTSSQSSNAISTTTSGGWITFVSNSSDAPPYSFKNSVAVSITCSGTDGATAIPCVYIRHGD